MKIFDTGNSSWIPDVDEIAIQETIYLLAVPGMCDSVKDGLAQSPKDLATSLDW